MNVDNGYILTSSSQRILFAEEITAAGVNSWRALKNCGLRLDKPVNWFCLRIKGSSSFIATEP